MLIVYVLKNFSISMLKLISCIYLYSHYTSYRIEEERLFSILISKMIK